MKYPATFTPDTGGFVVTFRDIPEAITQGDSEDEALMMAEDVLLAAIEVYFEEQRTVPPPSRAMADERLIALSASGTAKILLLNEMLSQSVAPAELAHRVGATDQEIDSLLDFSHPSPIDKIESAMAALGRDLALSLE